MTNQRRRIKRRSRVAHEVRQPIYRQRVEVDCTKYKRKHKHRHTRED